MRNTLYLDTVALLASVFYGGWGGKKLLRCAFMLLAAASLIFTAITPSYSAYYDEGNDGSSWISAYIINSKEDLVELKQRVNSGTEASGKYYILAANIDLTPAPGWEGIGYGNKFTGHFDGRHHTILIDVNNTGDVGLFYRIATGSQEIAVRNLTVKGYMKGRWAGGIAWCLDSGIIENCRFEGTCRAFQRWAGGIVDLMHDGIVRNCTVKAQISSTYSSGGIVAELYKGTVENCTVQTGTAIFSSSGSSQGITYTGGIIGLMHGGVLSGNQWPSAYPETGSGNPQFNGHQYQVFIDDIDWVQAEEKCEQLGGHLATITSLAEYNHIISLLGSSKMLYWLGASDINEEGEWQWITGEPFTFTQWLPGEPNGIKRENYLILTNYYYDQWGWNDGTINAVSPGMFGYICEWEDSSEPVNPSLSVTMIERRSRYGDTQSFGEENSLPDENIICWMDSKNYYDIKSNKVTEESIAELFSDEDRAAGYIKKGFTADGNTRLILRALVNAPGKVRFEAPQMGVVFEALNRTKGWADTLIEIPAYSIGANQYQATAVMISPKDYPTSSTYPFPRSSFNVHVTFIPDNGEEIAQDIPVELHAVPVVLIHGFGRGTTVDNTFGGENAKTGIHRKLLDAGLRVYPCNYKSKTGPLTVIPDATLTTYSPTPIFLNFAEALKNFAHDEDGIACTRADIVAHSMGGLISRRFIQDDVGNLNTIRSYGQGMVRRLITVGTPHEGSPYANWLLYNSLPKFWENSYWNRVRDGLTFSKLSSLGGRTVLGGAYWLAFKDTDDALFNFSLGSPLFGKLHNPSVPVYALYGKITGQKWERPEHEEYQSPYGAMPLQFWLPLVDWAQNEWDETKEDLSSWAEHGEMYTASTLRVVFGEKEEDCDGCVAASSAKSIFGDSSKGFTGWRFWHSLICHQNETGEKVVDLLKYSESAFKTFSSANNNAGHSVTAKNTVSDFRSAELSGDFFTVKFSVSIASSSDTASENETLTVNSPCSIKVRASAHEDMPHKVFAVLTGENGSNIYHLKAADSRNFEGAINFPQDVSGTFTVSCIASDGNDHYYISGYAGLIAAPQLEDIVALNFPSYMQNVFTNVNSDVGLSLYAETSDGKKYDAAFPASGTVWTADDPSIAKVTDEGRLLGLKEGSTVLTASNSGFIASVNVNVGPELVHEAIDSGTAPSIITDSLPGGQVSTSYSVQLEASGSFPVTWAKESGDLPEGVALSSSGLLEGTPGSSGSFTFSVAASNFAGTDSRSFMLNISADSGPEPQPASESGDITPEPQPQPESEDVTPQPQPQPTSGDVTPKPEPSPSVTAPSITTSSLPNGTAGKYYSASISVSGTTPITITLISGKLPEGLGFSDGRISGTPTKTGTFRLTFRASNSAGSVQKKLTLKIKAGSANSAPDDEPDLTPPEILTSSLPDGTSGKYYSAYISVSGTTPITISLSDGKLPEGLALSGFRIYGTPAETGTFTFTISASNSEGMSESEFTLSINAASAENKSDPNQDITPEPENNNGSDSEPVPDIVIINRRNISSLSDSELSSLSNDRTVIAAVLPELQVNKSGRYSFRRVQIYSNVPAGLPLVWNSFADSGQEQDNSYAEFYDIHGSRTHIVPDDKSINITAYLEAGKNYAPVITAILPEASGTNSDSSGGGGGCNSGITGALFAAALSILLVVRFK